MYGWLDTFFCAPRAWCAEPGERSAHVMPSALARWLPLLGSVLYVPSRTVVEAGRSPDGVLSESPLLAPLLHTRRLCVLGLVGADGPREWIECLDARGEILAQLHLLPDTDYLAWDNLPDESRMIASDPGRGTSRLFRGSAAHLMRFRCQSLANMLCLGEATAPHISPLGRVVAQAIAGSKPLLMQGLPVL
ncbi:hypothetical protein [Rhodanobacter sp. BL-MT-08]